MLTLTSSVFSFPRSMVTPDAVLLATKLECPPARMATSQHLPALSELSVLIATDTCCAVSGFKMHGGVISLLSPE